jgi:hypothetical protein
MVQLALISRCTKLRRISTSQRLVQAKDTFLLKYLEICFNTPVTSTFEMRASP